MKYDESERIKRFWKRQQKKADRRAQLKITGEPGGNAHDRRKARRAKKAAK